MVHHLQVFSLLDILICITLSHKPGYSLLRDAVPLREVRCGIIIVIQAVIIIRIGLPESPEVPRRAQFKMAQYRARADEQAVSFDRKLVFVVRLYADLCWVGVVSLLVKQFQHPSMF